MLDVIVQTYCCITPIHTFQYKLLDCPSHELNRKVSTKLVNNFEQYPTVSYYKTNYNKFPPSLLVTNIIIILSLCWTQYYIYSNNHNNQYTIYISCISSLTNFRSLSVNQHYLYAPPPSVKTLRNITLFLMMKIHLFYYLSLIFSIPCLVFSSLRQLRRRFNSFLFIVITSVFITVYQLIDDLEASRVSLN